MYCKTGRIHTICLSDDGIVYGLGYRGGGQLGITLFMDLDIEVEVNWEMSGSYIVYVSNPTPITSLPKIQQISCGMDFTVCIDEEGSVWSFGNNLHGQLGIGNKIMERTPQQIPNIPPMKSVSCGGYHTLLITNDSNLWSVGNNNHGQLFLKNTINCVSPKKTLFSNILKISSGTSHSLLQNQLGEIYVCGTNSHGQLGVNAKLNDNLIFPCRIENCPPNIIQIACGNNHTLFLDYDGNVFSAGDDEYGCLGIGENTKGNLINQILNIPPIKFISCAGNSCYLLDFDGNIWSFGDNYHYQLGLGDNISRKTPEQIKNIKNIKEISSGPFGCHFLAKDDQNQIFTMGLHTNGQIAKPYLDPEVNVINKMKPEYCFIWRDALNPNRAKSAKK